ncbi:MAG: hypothetical protein IJV82_06105 [Oscillospiraceae bacterium]|nr:hypothetical protein [Oscillospiraceae bacterium]
MTLFILYLHSGTERRAFFPRHYTIEQKRKQPPHRNIYKNLFLSATSTPCSNRNSKKAVAISMEIEYDKKTLPQGDDGHVRTEAKIQPA